MDPNDSAKIYSTLASKRLVSAQAYQRACQVIPSGTVSRARILPPFPFYAARGKGSRLFDIDGNEYVDCGMGFGSHLLGHAHPLVVQAIAAAVEDGTGYGTPHLREVELAELLVEAIPCADKVTFCNSGSEATLNAIRLARAVTGKMGIAKFEGGYQGWYDAVLGSVGSVAGPIEDPDFVSHSIGVPPENLVHSHVLPFNHPAAFEKIYRLKDQLAVVMIEAVQGAGGAIPVQPEFLTELRRVCTEAGVLLLLDEIITGFRLAYGGAQAYYGVKADLATYSKVVGAGLPLGIIAGTSEVMSRLGSTGSPALDFKERVYYGGTFNGCVPAMAVGIAVLSYLKEHPEIYAALNGTGEKLRRCLREVVAEEDYPVTIVGEGSLFMARFVPGGVRSVRDLAQENVAAMRVLYLHLAKYGVFIPQAHFALISAAHTDAEVELIAEAYRHSFGNLRAAGLM
ncbi:MAG TPA: aspartate aminotransferase family protein [Anaerolineae bacterium]|nr:aspartate aminotransferase family protein [Anaerolineae bacterium]